MYTVKVQIWTAVSVYVMVASIKQRLDLNASLCTLLQIFCITPRTVVAAQLPSERRRRELMRRIKQLLN